VDSELVGDVGPAISAGIQVRRFVEDVVVGCRGRRVEIDQPDLSAQHHQSPALR